MISNKIKTAIVVSSLFLSSAAYSVDTNSNSFVQRQIEQNVSALTNLAQNANGWKVKKNGDTKEYSILKNDDFVLVKIKPAGLEMIGYAGNGKTIWDDKEDGWGLNSRVDAFEEYSGNKRVALYQNPSVENVARVNRIYLSVLENLNKTLDKTRKTFFRRLLDRLEE